VKTLGVLLDWQKQLGRAGGAFVYKLEQFTLMFTTQVGPQGLPEEYMTYLRDHCLKKNLDGNDNLKPLFRNKSEGRTVAEFFEHDFDGAFKLSVPKSLIELVGEADWYVDSERGIEVYQFDRVWKGGSYRMLHMAMTVRRQAPPKEKRGPGQPMPDKAAVEQRKTIEKLFENPVLAVEELVVGDTKAKLEIDLRSLFAHRRRYYDPDNY
jgi:hypothetical protein